MGVAKTIGVYMLKRVIAGLLGLVILIFVLLMGGWVLVISTAIISIIGQIEIINAIAKKMNIIGIATLVISAAYILTIPFFAEFGYLLEFILVLILISALLFVFNHSKIDLKGLLAPIFSFFYVAIFLSTIYLIYQQYMGAFTIWLVCIAAWGSDTGAYFFGISMGKHKLAPILSPKKTIEGSIGGLLTAAVLSFIFGLILYFSEIIYFEYTFWFVLIGFVGAVFGQIGDLAASVIKRKTNIKDFGKIMPGHGGVLDRFDSILFVAPVIYLLTELVVFR